MIHLSLGKSHCSSTGSKQSHWGLVTGHTFWKGHLHTHQSQWSASLQRGPPRGVYLWEWGPWGSAHSHSPPCKGTWKPWLMPGRLSTPSSDMWRRVTERQRQMKTGPLPASDPGVLQTLQTETVSQSFFSTRGTGGQALVPTLSHLTLLTTCELGPSNISIL